MRKFVALFLYVLLILSMAACGKAQGVETGNVPELVYVPEYFELGDEGEDILKYDALLDGDMLCHPVLSREEGVDSPEIVLHRHSLTQGRLVEFPLKDGAWGINAWTLGVDGSMYFVMFGWSSEEAAEASNAGTVLVKYGRTGRMSFWRDITELLPSEDSFSLRITTDNQGRTYLLTEKGILLFDEKGNPSGTISVNANNGVYFGCFGRGSDGKVYLSGVEENGKGDGFTLHEVDYQTAKLGAGLAGFPAARGSLTQDAVGNIVAYDNIAVYTYNLETQEKEQLFFWTDSGIDAANVNTVGVLSDGRIAVFYRDWQTGVSGVALLSGVDVAEAVQKQEIVIAQLFPNPDLPAAATLFNGISDKYHITVKNYLKDFAASQEEEEAAKTRLIADIVSGNGPDILNPLGLSMEMEELISLGAFEDLNPYLDQSSVLDREDMIESVLNAETYDGVLISIPASFSVYTYFGSSPKVGEEMGWAREDVIALLEANPGATICDGFDKTGILFFCLDFNDYVDWERALCSFDSEEFKDLLEFVAQLSVPEDSAFDSGGWDAVMERLRSGETLLLFTGVSGFTDLQLVQERFQSEVTAIGYPTSDGSVNSNISVQDTAVILSQTKVKEGAWEFIEYYLTKGNDRYRFGFPNSWSKLEELIVTESSRYEVRYKMGEDYWYEAHIPTQEEIDAVLDIIRAGKNMNLSADEVMLRQIIGEEAVALFQGQKTVDQVADAIQRRAALYVSENS